MSAHAPRYDRVARLFRPLEYITFGRSLERARERGLADLAAPRHALLLGEGDGRFLAELARRFPRTTIDCIDGSGGMLAIAERRLRTSVPDAASRVRFVEAEILTGGWEGKDAYDLVVTNFVLDCFDPEGIGELVRKVSRLVAPEATWLVADFANGHGRFAKLRSTAWLSILYAFFATATGQAVRRLHDPDESLAGGGWRRERRTAHRLGLLRSETWRRTGPPNATSDQPSREPSTGAGSSDSPDFALSPGGRTM